MDLFSTVSELKMRIDSSGQVGIGTSTPGTPMIEYNEWFEILKLAETNNSVKLALDQLKTTYYLSKDHGSKT